MSFAILERSKYPYKIATKTSSKVINDFKVWGEGFQYCKIHPFQKKSATEAVLLVFANVSNVCTLFGPLMFYKLENDLEEVCTTLGYFS